MEVKTEIQRAEAVVTAVAQRSSQHWRESACGVEVEVLVSNLAW